MHPNKALRQSFATILEAAAITVEVKGASSSVSILKNPPSGGWIDQDRLPGLYCFARSERNEASSMKDDKRSFLIDVVLQAKGLDGHEIDQVDDMQLAVEQALMSNPTLGGLVYDFRLTGSEIYSNQGEVVFAARRLTFEATGLFGRLDPSV